MDSINYTIKSGSTIATLSNSYLSTLDKGTYTLTFVYTDGEVSTIFVVESTGSIDENSSNTTDNSTTNSTSSDPNGEAPNNNGGTPPSMQNNNQNNQQSNT